MNSVIRPNTIISVGLLPAIICMILCIFLLDAYVIYGCTILCAIYFIYLKIKNSILQPNIIFINNFIALLICSLVKLSTGNNLIPDKAVPLTLGLIIFCLSLLYMTFPHVYNTVYKFIFYKVSILNQIGSQLIVFFSMIYIFLSCLLLLFFSPISSEHLYWLNHIIPPIVYILSIIANYFTLITISGNYKKHPILRVITIHDGQILISKRSACCFENNKLDTPIEDVLVDPANLADKAKRISSLSLGINQSKIEPRFSVKYLSTSPFKNDIILFILPIKNRNDIKFKQCNFISPDEIMKNIERYSSFMKEEINHISVAAKIWKEQNPFVNA